MYCFGVMCDQMVSTECQVLVLGWYKRVDKHSKLKPVGFCYRARMRAFDCLCEIWSSTVTCLNSFAGCVIAFNLAVQFVTRDVSTESASKSRLRFSFRSFKYATIRTCHKPSSWCKMSRADYIWLVLLQAVLTIYYWSLSHDNCCCFFR